MRISDEQLNHLADRFVGHRVRQILKITFEQYLTAPDRYDCMIAAFEHGAGITIQHGVPRVVAVH